MANYKVVDAEQLDNDLRSIADTIRAKNGTTEDINFPEGYIAAYESTPTIIENVEANLNFANGDQMESLPEGYAAKSVKIKKPENLTPENIAEGVEIAGIVGTHEGGCDHNIIEHIEIALDFSNGDLTERLPEGYSANSVTIFKPDTLIPENIAKDVNIAGIVGTHEGGGSVEGTATVTFCNYDGSVLYTRLVFIGDDCASPVTQGKLDTPTRASDVQYNYTFSGWSATQGGSASSTVLNNITADKTVYAAYTTSLVYYTVRFYDGDTLMQESQVGYGQTATPPSTMKSGYTFISWSIDGVVTTDFTITKNTDIYGLWELCQGYILKNAITDSTLSSTSQKTQCCFSPDGKYFAVCTNGSQLNVYNTSNNSLVFTSSSIALCVAFSKNSQYLAFGNSSGVSIYACGTWTSYASANAGYNVSVRSVGFARDDSRLYYMGHNSSTKYWINMETKSREQESTSYKSNMYIRTGGDIVVRANTSNAIECYKWTGTEEKLITLPDTMSTLGGFAVNDTGTKIFACSYDGTDNRLYTINDDLTVTYEVLPFTFLANNALYYAVLEPAFAPNANVLAVPAVGNGVTFVELDKKELYYDPDVKMSTESLGCAYSADGLKFASVGYVNSSDGYKGVYIYDTVRT